MEALNIARILVAAFFAVLFLQSGMDKAIDRKGNLEYLSGHFATSPLRPMVPLLLAVLTFLEVATGAVCAVGLVMLVTGNSARVAAGGLALAALTLVSLFAGQRIAKDYAGAASLAAYFAVALIGLWLFAS